MTDMTLLQGALDTAPLVPVLTVQDPASVAPLAAALIAGGIQVAEITLRTPAALEVLSEFKNAPGNLIIGAGTVLTDTNLENALKAGAEFIVTPGVTDRLAAALLNSGTIAIPGVATPGEAMRRYEDGFRLLKLFPAGAVGGIKLLKSLAGPLPHIHFMPTGGVSPDNAGDYLALPNVRAVGGSWLATEEDIAAGDWDAVKTKSADSLARLGAS